MEENDVITYVLTATEIANLGLDSDGNNITVWEWPLLDKWAGCKHLTVDCDMEIPLVDNTLPLFDPFHNEFWEKVRQLLLDDRLDGFAVKSEPKKVKEVWFCKSGTCRGRENDRGYTCYWCGASEC